MKLKITAKFEIIKYNGEIGEIAVTKEFNAIAISNETIMKALNLGDISNIQKPFSVDGYNSDIDLMFKNNEVFRNCNARDIETEPIYGQIRFVGYRERNKVMKWEYVNEK